MTSRNYGALRESADAVQIIDRVRDNGKVFAFDIEAGYHGEDEVQVSLKQFHPKYAVTGISFTDSPSWARYIPFDHDDGGNVDDIVPVGRALWRLLRSGRGIAHNAAYELKGMSRWFRENFWRDEVIGAEVQESRGMFDIHADTQLMVWLAADFHPIKVGKDLKSVAEAAFGLKMTHFEDLFPTVENEMGPVMKKGKIRFARFNTRNAYDAKVIAYACEDSVASLMVYRRYEEMITDIIFRAESALIPVLVEMEMGPVDENGKAQGNMMFDWVTIRKKSEECERFGKLMAEEILDELSTRLNRVININLNSAKQLSEVLFAETPEGLGLPVKIRSDKTNAPSTSDDALKVIAKSDPIIRKMLQYRQVVKLNSAYLMKFINEAGYSGTGVVFPNHNQMGALTGRMSVDQISYQQWPKPYHFELDSGVTFDLNFRDLFIAQDDFRIVGFDYANVEMRIAGAMSGETKIIDAFNNGEDLHKSTAAATFRVPLSEVTKKQRSGAKTLNFAILYGSGAANIAEQLTSPSDPVTKADAEKMLDDYLAGYPDLANWIARQKAHGREQKWVQTHFGRKFTLWDYYAPLEWQRAKGDRMTVNAPVQGTAADIIKIAMVRAQGAIKKAGLQDLVRMTLTVHDALEFLVHKSIDTQTVIDLLEPCVNFPIPGFPLEIRADWHEGYQWGAVAEVNLDANKQITGYTMEYELPWAGEAHEWQGKTLHEALDPYYEWEDQKFGMSATFYRSHNPDFTLTYDTAPEAPQEAVSAPVEPEEDAPELITVTMTEQPTVGQWEQFVEFLSAHPGPSTLRVETPEGIATADGSYLLTAEHQPLVSLMLGGATLSFWSGEADAEEVFFGAFSEV